LHALRTVAVAEGDEWPTDLPVKVTAESERTARPGTSKQAARRKRRAGSRS
jgi:hypothetical protein